MHFYQLILLLLSLLSVYSFITPLNPHKITFEGPSYRSNALKSTSEDNTPQEKAFLLGVYHVLEVKPFVIDIYIYIYIYLTPSVNNISGTGFLQFMVSSDLLSSGVALPVLMSDKAKQEGVQTNWAPPPAVVVTNGEGEWEVSVGKGGSGAKRQHNTSTNITTSCSSSFCQSS